MDFFEILTVFWAFFANEWTESHKIWSCFTLFCLLANRFEVLPLAPLRRFSQVRAAGLTALIPLTYPPSAAAHPALPKSGGAEGAQKKEETLSYPTSYERASNSF